jgi:hypothetical protein
MPLSPKQQAGLQLMIGGASNGAVAKRLQIRPETASRWRQLPQFKDALASATDPDLTDGDANLTFLRWRGYDVLLGLLESEDEQIRLKASSEVFKLFGTRLPPYRGPDQEPVEDLANDD